MAVYAAILVTTFNFIFAPDISFAQTKWETFKDPEGLVTAQIPSNWVPQKVSEELKLTPIDIQFVYIDKNDSSVPAWIDIMISESLNYNTNDSLESIIAGSRELEDYTLLQPIECSKYMLNSSKACSIVESYKNVGENQLTKSLSITNMDNNGIEYLVYFAGTPYAHDKFLPIIKHLTDTLTFNSSRIAEVLNLK